jgi:hypothetical protein
MPKLNSMNITKILWNILSIDNFYHVHKNSEKIIMCKIEKERYRNQMHKNVPRI